MATVTLKVRVRRDGTLALPRKAREELGLRQGEEVEITLRTPDAAPTSRTDNPLLGIIGIGKGGPVDGAENHDDALYRRRWA